MLMVIALLVAARADAADGPPTLVWDGAALAANKAQLAEPDSPLKPALDALVADAEKALDQPPVSVMEKDELPPSGDKHDYMSLALYAWPNPDTADGLPYIRKDGEVSPTAYKIPDKRNKGRMQSAVETLSLAYYFTGDERYADHAALLLRTWFIDPATRMNPNLRYAQAWLGRDDGRFYGIIDTAGFSMLPDYAALLAGSPSWTATDEAGMRKWCGEYKDWLTESDFGKAEEATTNNHGSWWDCQVVALALYCGDLPTARRVCEKAKTRRIAAHVKPDGSQPHELARTKSWDYSVYNLRALARLARLAEHTGTPAEENGTAAEPPVDLWGYVSPDGASIAAAIDYLMLFVVAPDTWAHKQIKEMGFGGLGEAVRLAALATGDEQHAEEARKLDAKLSDSDRRWLEYPKL